MIATFKCSSAKLSQLPTDGLPEIAFIGRSNVGKSSLINMLTGRTGLAKVSATPGKTRLVNHFLVDNSWYLVDLPGYGYARVSKSDKEKFAKIIIDYVLRAPQLHYLFVLVDSRLEPQKIDLEFISLLGANRVPFGIIFTKSDKQSADKTASNIARFSRALRETWEELPPMLITSSAKKQGAEEVLGAIKNALAGFDERA
jgi:GTP-binding protein